MFNVLAATYGTISDIELMWTLIALAGASFSVWNIKESRRDLAALRESKIGNGRYQIATQSLRAEIITFAIQLIHISIGIVAMTLREYPATLQEPLKLVIFRFLFTWGLIAVGTMLLLKSYWNYQLRRYLLQQVVEEGTYLHETKEEIARRK